MSEAFPNFKTCVDVLVCCFSFWDSFASTCFGMWSVAQITFDWLTDNKVFACITKLRNVKSVLGPVPPGRQNNFKFWSDRVWPSPSCNHYANQLTIFFCSLCHCSLTSFRSLSNSFFLVSSGWTHTQRQMLNMLKSLLFPTNLTSFLKQILRLPVWICGSGVRLWCGVPAGCIQCHFWKQSCRFHGRA